MDVNMHHTGKDSDASYVWSTPPYTSRGTYWPATIFIEPWGLDPSEPFPSGGYDARTGVKLSMTVDEAEDLISKLTDVVSAAKDGVYTKHGEKLKQFARETRLKDAWSELTAPDNMQDEP